MKQRLRREICVEVGTHFLQRQHVAVGMVDQMDVIGRQTPTIDVPRSEREPHGLAAQRSG